MAKNTQSKMNTYLKSLKKRGVKLNKEGEVINPTPKIKKEFESKFKTKSSKGKDYGKEYGKMAHEEKSRTVHRMMMDRKKPGKKKDNPGHSY